MSVKSFVENEMPPVLQYYHRCFNF